MFGKIPRPNIFGNMTQSSHPVSQFMSGAVDTMTTVAGDFASKYGTQITNTYDSHVAKGVAKRQNIIGQHKLDHQNNLEKYKAEFQDGLPKNWGAALESAGGASGAAWRVGANAVAGGIAGGAIDASMGNDSWTDGAMIGGALGGIGGAGSFAKQVHGLKVGKFTESSNPISYVNKNNTNSGRHVRPSKDGSTPST